MLFSGYEAKVDNKTDEANARCITAREKEDIVNDCLALVGQTIPYSRVSNNCEHFVTRMRYGGEGWSDQVCP